MWFLLLTNFSFWQVCSFDSLFVSESVCLDGVSHITHESVDISSPNFTHRCIFYSYRTPLIFRPFKQIYLSKGTIWQVRTSVSAFSFSCWPYQELWYCWFSRHIYLSTCYTLQVWRLCILPRLVRSCSMWYVWFQGTKSILPDDRVTLEVLEDEVVMTCKAAKKSDEGPYNIVLKNKLGKDTANVNVTVLGKKYSTK